MIIKKIKLENIRSYEQEEITFPLGSTVLAGDIGTGKTSVLLAIEFALFGLQPGQKGSSLLRNDKNKGSVSLEIEIDNKNIKIERGLERKKSVNQSYSILQIDEKKQEISVTELKNKVLELLNYPKEFERKTNFLYRFTVYTPQEEMKQIILEPQEVRLNTLRHIFGIDKYKRIRENTSLFITKLREFERLYEGQIKDFADLQKKLQEKQTIIKELEKNLENLQDKLEKTKAERNKAEIEAKKIEEKIKEKEKYEQEIEKTKIMLAGKKEIFSGIEREKILLEKQIQEAEKITFKPELTKEIELKIKEQETRIENKNKTYMEVLSKIQALNSKISENEKNKSQISFLRICPTCFQDIPEEYKKNILRKFNENIEQAKKEINSFVLEEEKILNEIEMLKKDLTLLKNEINKLELLKMKLETIKEKQLKLEQLEKQKTSILEDMKMLEKEISMLKESSFLLKKYENIYKENKKVLDNLLILEKGKEIELATIEKERELNLNIIEELNKEILRKELTKKKLLKLVELEDWLSNNFLSIIAFTERNIMLKLKEEFSKLFNEWFNILVPEIFSVSLDEDFTPLIEQQDYQLDYSFLSGGERTAVALAYRLALNQVINSLLSRIKTRELVILDEPTDGFSEQQLDKMRDVLNELKVKQLIIVSHESKIESFVENIIKFKKEEGVTKVEK